MHFPSKRHILESKESFYRNGWGGRDKRNLDWNVNTFFIPVPKGPVHAALKELLITFTTRSRMTNENLRLRGSSPLFFWIHTSCIPTNCYPATPSVVERVLIYVSELREWYVSEWKANRAYGKSPHLKIPSRCAAGCLAHCQEACGYKHF